MSNINEIIENFENSVIPNNIEYQKNFSIKTNFLNLFKFLNKSFELLKIFKEYINYLKTQINASDIVNQVITNLQDNKFEFILNINSELNISNPITINNIYYKVTKTKINEFEISRDLNNWEVNKLIVQCKLIDGTVIYPKIITFANKITIITTEPINSNIIVYII